MALKYLQIVKVCTNLENIHNFANDEVKIIRSKMSMTFEVLKVFKKNENYRELKKRKKRK
jgi:hypothetical protein